MKIFKGNLDDLAPKHKGWFVGHFMEDDSLFKTQSFEMKWDKLKKGQQDYQLGTQTTAKTLGILVYGEFEYIFPKENKKITLNKQGDFLFYDAGVTHIWKVHKSTLLISIRWPSIPGDQK